MDNNLSNHEPTIKMLKSICRQARVQFEGIAEGLPSSGIPHLVSFSWRGKKFSLPFDEFDAVSVRKLANPPERRRMVWQTRVKQLVADLERLEQVHSIEMRRDADMWYGGKIADAWAVLYGFLLRSPIAGAKAGVTYLRQNGERLFVSKTVVEKQKRQIWMRARKKKKAS